MSDVFIDGKDVGYREDQNWWSNPNNPEAFRIADLNEDYPTEYFEKDHVSEKTVENYCNAVIRQYELFTRHRVMSILEFGCGGGWFLNEFVRRGYAAHGYEGSPSGLSKCREKGLSQNIDSVDLRRPLQKPTGKRDIVLCTEVAEHIEPPFAATLVYNATIFADIIWWSSEEPNTNKPHLHHSNEQPDQFWINLFNHFGYSAMRLSDEIYASCEGRGKYIFYSRYKFPYK